MPRRTSREQEKEKEKERGGEIKIENGENTDDAYLWQGEPSKSDRGGYVHYTQLTVVTKEYEKHNFSIGDVVFMLSDGPDPFIGEIEDFYEKTSSHEKYVITRWFYRVNDLTEDVLRGLGSHIVPYDLFISTSRDVNLVQSILKPCVLYWLTVDDPLPEVPKRAESHFICRYRFNVPKATAHKLITQDIFHKPHFKGSVNRTESAEDINGSKSTASRRPYYKLYPRCRYPTRLEKTSHPVTSYFPNKVYIDGDRSNLALSDSEFQSFAYMSFLTHSMLPEFYPTADWTDPAKDYCLLSIWSNLNQKVKDSYTFSEVAIDEGEAAGAFISYSESLSNRIQSYTADSADDGEMKLDSGEGDNDITELERGLNVNGDENDCVVEANEDEMDHEEDQELGPILNAYEESSTVSRRGRRKKRGRTGWRGRPHHLAKRSSLPSSSSWDEIGNNVGEANDTVIDDATDRIEGNGETGRRFLTNKRIACSRVGADYQADLDYEDLSAEVRESVHNDSKSCWRPQELDDTMFGKYMQLAKLLIYSRKLDVLLAIGATTKNTLPIVDGSFLLVIPFVDSRLADIYYETDCDTAAAMADVNNKILDFYVFWGHDAQSRYSASFLKYGDKDLRRVWRSVMNCTDKSLEQIMDYHYRCIQPAVLMEAPEMSYLDYAQQKLAKSRSNDSVGSENAFLFEGEDNRADEGDEDIGLDEDKEQKYQSQSVKFIKKCHDIFDKATYALLLNAILQFRRNVLSPAALIVRVRHIFQTSHVKPEVLSDNAYGDERYLDRRNEILSEAFNSFVDFLPQKVKKVVQPKYVVGMGSY